MKPYLARLAARATSAVATAHVPARSVADPLSETEAPAAPLNQPDANVQTTETGMVQSLPTREYPPSRPTPEVSSEMLPSSPAKPASLPSIPEIATSVELNSPELEQSPQPVLLSKPVELPPWSAAPLPGTEWVRPVPPTDDSAADGRDATRSNPGEPISLSPREDEQLRLADVFMAGLREKAPDLAPIALQQPEAPVPMPAREPAWPDIRTASPRPDREPAPSVTIGSLRVEVVQAPASPTGAIQPPARAVRRGGARGFGRGHAARQHFGLRQL